MSQSPISTIGPDLQALALLFEQALAPHGHARAFLRHLKGQDWASKPSEALQQAIRWCVTLEALQEARTLIALGQNRFPQDSFFDRWAELLAPPKVITTQGPANPRLADSIAWLDQHTQDYSGWLAVLDGQLVGQDVSLEQLLAALGPQANEPALLVEHIA